MNTPLAPRRGPSNGPAMLQPQRPQNLAPMGGRALQEARQQREVTRLQVQVMAARSYLRDEQMCMETLLQWCDEPSNAESAIYSFVRGGKEVRGPTVKLLQLIGARWGEIHSEFHEERHDGYSVCEVVAWDLQTGYYDVREVYVKHWRDTQGGGHPIQSQRDIGEWVANVCQRVKRECMKTVIPQHVVDACVARCEETLAMNADLSPAGLATLLASFAEYGVTRAMIEAKIQRRFDAITPKHVVDLRGVYSSLKHGEGTVADHFRAPPPVPAPTGATAPPDEPPAAGTGTQRARDALRKKRTPAPTPAPSGDGSQVQPPADDGDPFTRRSTLAELRSSLLEAPSREDALLVMDVGRTSLTPEEQQALQIVFDQQWSAEDEEGGAP